jgi:hypothetical protein
MVNNVKSGGQYEGVYQLVGGEEQEDCGDIPGVVADGFAVCEAVYVKGRYR